MRPILQRGRNMKRTIALVLALCLLLMLPGCARQSVDPPPQDKYRVYYEIFVGSFYDSDGDGIGDLAGIRHQMDYLNDGDYASKSSLHVTGLWLMPIMPSPTYHKYDVTDYYAVDPDYGTMADFEALLADCDARGVALILDLVVNHTSNEHPWFRAACKSIAIEPCGQEVCPHEALCRQHNPYCDYYVFAEEPLAGYHVVPGAGGNWYYEGQFWSGMPDLNLDSAAVREQIADICRFWLDKGVAGFRLDAVTSYYTGNAGSNLAFLSWLNTTVKQTHPDAYLVAEAWSDAGTIQNLYGSGIDSFFNFPFSQAQGTIIQSVNTGDGAGLARRIAAWDATLAGISPGAIDAPFLSNHDNARSAGALRRDTVLQKQAAAVYLLLPGNPFIYYGEEIAMTGGADNDPNKRAPLVWSTQDDTGIADPPDGTTKIEPAETGVAEQLADKNSLLRFYIDAIALRNSCPALARGSVTAVETGQQALCVYRVEYLGESYLVTHNLGELETAVDLAGQGTLSVFGTLSAGGGAPRLRGGTLTLPAHSTAVLRCD